MRSPFRLPALRRRKRSRVVLTGLALLLLLPALLPRAEAQQRLLRISAIPDQKPETLNRLYPLLANELSRSLGVPVRYVAVTDYTAAVSAFRRGDLDLVWFGALTGVQARLQKPGAKVIAQRDIDASFQSLFIANTASGIKPLRNQKGLTALMGKRFTFGSESSTSGRLMPQYYLGQAGVKLRHFAGGAPGFSGSHDATIALVQSGAYQAGVVNEEVWQSSLSSGRTTRESSRDLAHPSATPTTTGSPSRISTSALAGLHHPAPVHVHESQCQQPPAGPDPRPLRCQTLHPSIATAIRPPSRRWVARSARSAERWPPPKSPLHCWSCVASRCRAAGPTAWRRCPCSCGPGSA